jgi:hypothetical protein
MIVKFILTEVKKLKGELLTVHVLKTSNAVLFYKRFGFKETK